MKKGHFFEAVSVLIYQHPYYGNRVERVFSSYGLNGVSNMIFHVLPYSKKIDETRIAYHKRYAKCYWLLGNIKFLQHMADNGAEILKEYPEGYKLLSEIAMRSCRDALKRNFSHIKGRYYSSFDWRCYHANAEFNLDNQYVEEIANIIVRDSTPQGAPLGNLHWERAISSPPPLIEVRPFCENLLQKIEQIKQGKS